MPYEVFLAFRYLRSRHKRRLARATSVAAILGICMGVAALIVAFALSNGFRDEMRDKILQGTAHLSVLRTDGRAIENYAEVAGRVKQVDGVVNASATTYDGALVRGSKSSGYAVIRGIEKDAAQVGERGWMREGSFGPLFEATDPLEIPKAVVGADLAARVGLSVGEVFNVVPAHEAASGRTRRLRVVGIFRSGLFEYDSTWIYVPLDVAGDFAGNNHAASVLSVQVNDVDNVHEVSANVSKALGNSYTIVDWQKANQPLFSALALERRMGLFIIGLIIAIATLNITTMLILVVVERRRDIAILNALGATRAGVMLVFIIEGAVIGAIGAVTGVVLGFVLCVIGNHYKIVSLPADVYSISNVPLIPKPGEMILAALVAFVLSVLATIYPALAASRLRPVEALRDS
ncbi:MAG TPA: ABC transporter permease [Pyrinomonadaceae bacterium]|nr:ABC transporter permease [Pyrinomonadaceae bacterium]